jgi:hypothetical protein
MIRQNFLVFVGASPPLSDELKKLARSSPDLVVIAPASPRGDKIVSKTSSLRASKELSDFIDGSAAQPQRSRLSIWCYGPDTRDKTELLLCCFGRSSWVEFIPEKFRDKTGQTRAYIESRLSFVSSALHEVSNSVYAQRRRSFLPLPLRNFRSEIVELVQKNWYLGKDLASLKTFIVAKGQKFRQLHWTDNYSHTDSRGLVFSPAENEASHGLSQKKDDGLHFLEGRFRFGSALYPGFHYDVKKKHGKLDCVLLDNNGNERDMKREKRDYVNIFPNDYILPKQK